MLVDVHAHILPGVDDGPVSWDEMVALARQAVGCGITDVIATPHHMHRHESKVYENEKVEILDLVEEANERLVSAGVPLHIYAGVEFHVHRGIGEDLRRGAGYFLTLGNLNKYMLMELTSRDVPDDLEETFGALQGMGFTVILAHPERNRTLRRDPERIRRLVQQGVLMQVTAASVCGSHGRRLRNFSMDLLDHGLVHLVASDAHHAVRRPFELVEAYGVIEERYGYDVAEQLRENAVQVLTGQPVEVKEPREIAAKYQYFFAHTHPLNRKFSRGAVF